MNKNWTDGWDFKQTLHTDLILDVVYKRLLYVVQILFSDLKRLKET